MDIGTAMSVVQTLLAALQCSQLKDFCSKKSLNSQLDQLQRTVARIQAVLKDAELKQVLSEEEKVYIEQLKDAVYEADDLFDELVTLAQQKKLTEGTKDRLMSLFTKFKVDFKMSQKVDKIKQKLDGIAYNNQLLINFKHDPEPIKKIIRETCSKVDTVDIIGRNADLEKLVGMLLESDDQQDVSFISIVGIGGLGKTALAQLLYNDQRVKSAFSLRVWTCVSDQDQKQLDIKRILGKVLESATETRHHDASLELVQSQLGKQLFKGKYLLVLDDVWTEDREQWQNLVKFLAGSQKGSWIVVTTRSQKTGRIIGDGAMHLLQGLSEEDSWRLFERAAFGSEKSNPPDDLVNLGQKIVERCASVPLAIRVAGSLLYGQDKSRWLSFLEVGLTKIEESKNGIMPILKLSYHQLESPLKSCFGYCALFPKDYEIPKKNLMRLWMAQGYIQSSDQQCMEYVAEEYFLVLLRRCFFQDVREDIFGDIESCKIHDLMHDVAKEVIGKEICTGDAIVDAVDEKVRHICTIRSEFKSYSFNKTSIRSYLQCCNVKVAKMDHFPVDALLLNWKYLRVLDLSKLGINNLPSSISEMLHLRNLNLSNNYNLEKLPRHITKLYNLQTLDLSYCESLKELPTDTSKLVKLRVLDIRGCDRLSFMPRGMGTLSCLQVLPMFVVGEANASPEKLLNDLEDLKTLVNLKGDLKLKIGFCKQEGNVEKDSGRDKGCLRNKEHLNSVELSFKKEKDERRVENDEAIIEELQPHSNLKGIHVCNYQGMRMPKWARDNTLANLVNIRFHECPNLQSLGCIGFLQHLKFIQLSELLNLEYLIDISDRGASSAAHIHGVKLDNEDDISIFPSLETLYLWGLPKMKGWWRGMGMRDDDQLLKLPNLKKITLFKCPNLAALVECLTLEDLYLYDFNKKFGIVLMSRR